MKQTVQQSVDALRSPDPTTCSFHSYVSAEVLLARQDIPASRSWKRNSSLSRPPIKHGLQVVPPWTFVLYWRSSRAADSSLSNDVEPLRDTRHRLGNEVASATRLALRQNN